METVKLTSREIDLVVSALGVAWADRHNSAWVDRVLAGTRSKSPAHPDEVGQIWTLFNRARVVEVALAEGRTP